MYRFSEKYYQVKTNSTQYYYMKKDTVALKYLTWENVLKNDVTGLTPKDKDANPPRVFMRDASGIKDISGWDPDDEQIITQVENNWLKVSNSAQDTYRVRWRNKNRLLLTFYFLR